MLRRLKIDDLIRCKPVEAGAGTLIPIIGRLASDHLLRTTSGMFTSLPYTYLTADGFVPIQVMSHCSRSGGLFGFLIGPRHNQPLANAYPRLPYEVQSLE